MASDHDARSLQAHFEALAARAAPPHDWTALRHRIIQSTLSTQGELLKWQRKRLHDHLAPEVPQSIAALMRELDALRSLKVQLDAKLVELDVS